MVEFLLPYFLYHWGRGFLLSFLIISPPSTDSQLSPLPASPWLNSCCEGYWAEIWKVITHLEALECPVRGFKQSTYTTGYL